MRNAKCNRNVNCWANPKHKMATPTPTNAHFSCLPHQQQRRDNSWQTAFSVCSTCRWANCTAAAAQSCPSLQFPHAPLAALLAVICLPYLLPSLNSTHQALLAAQLQVNCRNVCQSISQILRYFSCEAGKRYDAKCQYSCCQFTHTLCVCGECTWNRLEIESSK